MPAPSPTKLAEAAQAVASQHAEATRTAVQGREDQTGMPAPPVPPPAPVFVPPAPVPLPAPADDSQEVG